eukprot:4360006-Ditylum_brightwellii.AAC.1
MSVVGRSLVRVDELAVDVNAPHSCFGRLYGVACLITCHTVLGKVLEVCQAWHQLVLHIKEYSNVDDDRLGAVTKSQQSRVARLLVEDGGSKLLQMM